MIADCSIWTGGRYETRIQINTFIVIDEDYDDSYAAQKYFRTLSERKLWRKIFNNHNNLNDTIYVTWGKKELVKKEKQCWGKKIMIIFNHFSEKEWSKTKECKDHNVNNFDISVFTRWRTLSFLAKKLLFFPFSCLIFWDLIFLSSPIRYSSSLNFSQIVSSTCLTLMFGW
jgi:hypothetical protein